MESGTKTDKKKKRVFLMAVCRGGGRGRLGEDNKTDEEDSDSDEFKGHRELDSPHSNKLCNRSSWCSL